MVHALLGHYNNCSILRIFVCITVSGGLQEWQKFKAMGTGLYGTSCTVYRRNAVYEAAYAEVYYLLEYMISIMLTAGSRFAYRLLRSYFNRERQNEGEPADRVMVIRGRSGRTDPDQGNDDQQSSEYQGVLYYR